MPPTFPMLPNALQAELVAKAQGRIKDRLFADAKATDAEIRAIGGSIAKDLGCQAIYGPIKTQESAERKIYGVGAVFPRGANDRDDEGNRMGDWYDLKDAVRMTIVAPTEARLREVQAEIRRRVHPSKGLTLRKDVETFANTNPCGFSGLNFVVKTSNGQPAEIQVNTQEVFYGQQTAELSLKALGPKKVITFQSLYALPGGLGHGLYEIWRVDQAGQNGLRAAKASRAYYAYLRQPASVNATELLTLIQDIALLISHNPHDFHGMTLPVSTLRRLYAAEGTTAPAPTPGVRGAVAPKRRPGA